MDIPGTISALTGALQVVKDLRAIDAGFDKAELKASLVDVMSSLADAKIALTEAEEKIANQKKEILKLRSSFEKRAELVEYKGFKFEAKEDGHPKGDPFCPRCEQKDGFLMRLVQGLATNKLNCPECKSSYNNVSRFSY
ncbi:hypothetical protein LQT97_00630 [Brucella pseudogrignonensis]|uniref:hypothetical protein n=1 Tax=Brucella pseudogrignonensis TaxID=419475 RepID=UPI001E39C739|nr:hypothetical protein [Brucella pseudogrignonensis]MCD4509729.1 hypothetical protein [Brucella pseudogrignonensis]